MTDKNARPGRRVGSQNRESIWLCSGSTKRYLWANSTDIEKETATNRSSTTRTGTVRYGLKIISFEVTVRTDKGTDFEDAVSGLHRFVRSKTVGVVLDCTCLIEARRERQFSNYVLRIQLSTLEHNLIPYNLRRLFLLKFIVYVILKDIYVHKHSLLWEDMNFKFWWRLRSTLERKLLHKIIIMTIVLVVILFNLMKAWKFIYNYMKVNDIKYCTRMFTKTKWNGILKHHIARNHLNHFIRITTVNQVYYINNPSVKAMYNLLRLV